MGNSIEHTLWEAVQRNTSWIKKRCAQAEFHPQKREELFQDIMLKLIQSNSHFAFQEIDSADAWVKRIASNTALTHQRDESRKLKADGLEDYEQTRGHEENKDNRVEINEIIKFMNDTFSPRDQEIMNLAIIREEYKMIGKIVGMKEGSIANKVSELKEVIEKHFYRGKK